MSQWVTLLEQLSGILYLDLVISHSSETCLKWAEFELIFRESTNQGKKLDGTQVTQQNSHQELPRARKSMLVLRKIVPLARDNCHGFGRKSWKCREENDTARVYQ